MPWLEPPFYVFPGSPAEARPYFGEIAANGGPRVRTERMAAAFGNYWISPNILYVNSAGGFSLAALRAMRRRKRGPRIVVNQNGLYYPAWYQGDWSAQNEYFREIHSLADHVIFQSQFCLEAFEALIGKASGERTVLHNAPLLPAGEAVSEPEKGLLLLAGVWGADSTHVIAPALAAMKELAPAGFRLRLAGTFTAEARRTDWFPAAWREIEAFRAAGHLEFTGPYRAEDLPRILKGVEIALHLRYQDSCPNAVVERMAYGIPHVYSSSGGTPELVGDSGIGLAVPKSWERLQAVMVPDLIGAVVAAQGQWRQLASAAKARQERLFSWEGYERAHRDIFRKVLVGAQQ